MPQIEAYYFTSQAVCTLLGVAFVVYVFSVYILPLFVNLFVSRVYVTKL